MSSLNTPKLENYLFRLKENKHNLAQLSDQQIMELMSVERDGKPTLTAELLWELYPQAFFPQLGIIATAVQGTEYCESQPDGSRFSDNKRIEVTIPEMLDGAMNFVRANTRVRTVIDKEGNGTCNSTSYVLYYYCHSFDIPPIGFCLQLPDRIFIIPVGGIFSTHR